MGSMPAWHIPFRKTSIAVLPFNSLSGDPGQAYFSDGFTEQIIASFSRTLRMFVIIRNSTFVYKGKPVKVQKIAEDFLLRISFKNSAGYSLGRIIFK
jgi:TolB-like protein